MPSTFTTDLNLELQATGENDTSWGTKLNSNFTILDNKLGTTYSTSMADADFTITQANAANANITATGAITANRNFIFPAGIGGMWVFLNNTTGAFTVTVKVASGTGVVVPQGTRLVVNSDGTNMNNAVGGVLGSTFSVSVAGSSDYTITTANALNFNLVATGALTGNINFILPANLGGAWVFYNNTSGSFTLTVKTSGGTGVVVPQGTRLLIDSDGTNVYNGTSAKQPTRTVLTTGTGATYTTKDGCTRINIRMVGGGGGGGGSGTSPSAPGNGTASTWSGGSLSAGGGTGASGANGGGGGSAANGDINIPGGVGAQCGGIATSPGGVGGASVFGGAGTCGASSSGGAAQTNSGSGGGGGASAGTANPGGGGGAGAYVEKLITSPAATYTYTVGALGGNGGGGTGGAPGGSGAAGIIIVDEYYN